MAKRGKGENELVPVLFIHSTLKENSDAVSGSHLLFWHRCVFLSVCLHVCVYPLLWLLEKRRCPTQHLSSCLAIANSHSIARAKEENKEIIRFKPGYIHILLGLLLRVSVCNEHSPAGQSAS